MVGALDPRADGLDGLSEAEAKGRWNAAFVVKEEEDEDDVVVVVKDSDETGVGMVPTPRHSSQGTVPKPEQ